MKQKLGIVADKCHQPQQIETLHNLFRKEGANYVYHLGSQPSPFLVPDYKPIYMLYTIFWPCDCYIEMDPSIAKGIPKLINFYTKMEEAGARYGIDYVEFEVEGIMCIACNGNNPRVSQTIISLASHDLFICGMSSGNAVEEYTGSYMNVVRPRGKTKTGKDVMAILYHLDDWELPKIIEIE